MEKICYIMNNKKKMPGIKRGPVAPTLSALRRPTLERLGGGGGRRHGCASQSGPHWVCEERSNARPKQGLAHTGSFFPPRLLHTGLACESAAHRCRHRSHGRSPACPRGVAPLGFGILFAFFYFFSKKRDGGFARPGERDI